MNETHETHFPKSFRTKFHCYNFINFKWAILICTTKTERETSYIIGDS